MKRTISLLLVVVLVFACMGTTVFAANAGETVTVTFYASNNPGFANFDATMSYDSSVLTLDSVTCNQSGATFVTNGNKVAFMVFTSNIEGNVALFTATFKIADNAAAGTYPVTASIGSVYNVNGDPISMSISGGSVTVDAAPCTHANTTPETKAASCTEDGYTKTICSDCGETLNTQVISATGHTYGAWTQTKAPTCTEKGEESHSCSACGDKETREVAAAGHTYGAWTQTKAPTCTEKGKETRTCACGDKETREVAAVGHTWGKETVVKEPNCTETGLKNQTCSVCGKTQNDVVIDALGHTWEEKVIKAATCEEAGEKELTCSVCGETKTEAIEALGHNCTWIVKTEATATTNGLKQYVCVNCGKVFDEAVISATGSNEELDDVPYTGDVTNQVVMIAVAVFAMFGAAVVCFRRKLAK